MAIPRKWIAANLHATDPLSNGVSSGLYVGGAGNVVCKMSDGATDVTVPAIAGSYILGKVTHVRATGTTATGIFAVYL